jgi:hypothetical protein
MKEFVECKASTWYESLSYREWKNLIP